MSQFVARWYAAIGAFQSSLLFRLLDGVPSKVLINRLYCLIVGIQASGGSILLFLLILKNEVIFVDVMTFNEL